MKVQPRQKDSMALTPRCWSWDHEHDRHPIALPLEKRHVCAAHLGEETAITVALAELSKVGVAVERFRQLPASARRGDAAKAIVEGAVRQFLIRGVEDRFRIGSGFRLGDERRLLEFDIVVDPREAVGWYGTGRMLDEGAPPYAHLEVAFRSWAGRSKIKQKLMGGVERLGATIRRGLDWHGGPMKTWTGMVLCGPGFDGIAELVAEVLHESTHAIPELRRVPTDGEDQSQWWPALDLVAGPGFFLKKSDVRTPNGERRLIWVIYRIPNTGDDEREVRSLAVARGFLHNFLSMREQGNIVERSPAWTGPPAATRGPVPTREDALEIVGSPVVAVAARDDEPPWAAWPQATGSPMPVRLLSTPRCPRGGSFYWATETGEPSRTDESFTAPRAERRS